MQIAAAKLLDFSFKPSDLFDTIGYHPIGHLGTRYASVHINKLSNLVSGAKLAHAAVHGGEHRVIAAPGAAQRAFLHQELI